ncbi:MAG: RNA polymerase sigma factor RpoD/SigA [Spirochaetaceae bacterium]|jgi:RNA polymerase primary sigma factor|nr:RNA polymerase sigma factor RpoD/SigA [Spirochaetaceae bacterium]
MRKTKTYSDEGQDALQTYLDEIKHIPLLNAGEEAALSKRIKAGDKAAKEQLFKANSRLVIKIARAYAASGTALLPDIIQEGNIGLMRAVEKYDHTKNARFSTYAGLWIRQYISRFLASQQRGIHLPHRKEECLRKVRKIEQELSQTLMREPSAEEVARALNMAPEDITTLLNRTSASLSFETESANETLPVIEMYEDYTYNPEEEFFKRFSQDSVAQILNRLKSREKWVLIHRYQINGCKRCTLRNLSDKMRVSPETVRQIENRALKKMYLYAKEFKETLNAI